MHTIEDIRREYDRLDALCGVDTRDIDITISNRMVKRHGSFRYPRVPGASRPRIAISALLLEEDDRFWNTVRHEYAHAVVWLTHPGEDHGHDQVWKAVCRRIGCTPKSTAPATPAQQTARLEKARYIVRCESCGHETAYLREGKVVHLLKSGRAHRLQCSLCGGRKITLRTIG